MLTPTPISPSDTVSWHSSPGQQVKVPSVVQSPCSTTHSGVACGERAVRVEAVAELKATAATAKSLMKALNCMVIMFDMNTSSSGSDNLLT